MPSLTFVARDHYRRQDREPSKDTSPVDHPQPTEQSIRLWERTGQPKDLVPITGTGHFLLAGNNPRTQSILKGWRDAHFLVAT
jgi:hypothetical protein